MSTRPKTTPTKEQRQAADPQRSVWVAANAGSGKTQVLVDRVVRLLLQGAEPQSILCLTYTKAAAAEMANRLFQRLSHWVGLSDADLDDEIKRLSGHTATPRARSLARTLFTSALETPGGLKIQTIHGFCERLLQLFPVESGMAPGFRVLDENESAALFRQSLLTSLTDHAEAWQFLDGSGVRSLKDLDALAKPFLSGAPGMRQRLGNLDDMRGIEAELRHRLGITSSESVPSDAIAAMVVVSDSNYRQAIKVFRPYGPLAKFACYDIMQRVLDATTDAARIAAIVDLVLTKDGDPRSKLISKPASVQNPVEAAWLEAERNRIFAELQDLALLQTLQANVSLYLALFRVMDLVNQTKRAKGYYDFDDLIAKTADLLKDNDAAQWVLYKLDQGLTHILVDEAQDTSPAQWTIVKALAGAFFSEEQRQYPRTVFAVGDIKQSIFSFQGADISSFEAAKLEFKSALTNNTDGLAEVDLAISYRSTQVVLDAVDQVFAPGQLPRFGFGLQADQQRDHQAFHTQRLGLVELWDVVRPDVEEETGYWKAPVDTPSTTHHRAKLAERLALNIKSWINQRKLSGHDRAVAAGDILILLQRRSPLFNAIIGALRKHDVPVAGADRLVLQNSLIVMDLQAFGQVLRMPDDDYALACFLKSPLAASPLSEDALLALAYDRGALSLFDRLTAGDANRLQIEQAMAATDTPFMLFAKLLQHAKQRILERLGPEAEDAVQEFLSLALDYEQQSGTSRTGFLDWLSEGDMTIKREMTAESEHVRIMTVHGAKGLEAPIVILADCADDPFKHKSKFIAVKGGGDTKDLHIFRPETFVKPDRLVELADAETTLRRQENFRLLYVAMTRAADELYICGSHNKYNLSDYCWYLHIEKALRDTGQLREITTDPELTTWRLGAEPVAIADVQPPHTSSAAIPAWALEVVPQHHQPQPIITAPRNSDQFDRAAVQRGIAIHRLLEVMVDAGADLRKAVGLRWAAKMKLPENLVDQFIVTLQQPELRQVFGEEGESEVSIHGEVEGLGLIHGRIDRLAVTGDSVIVLDYKTNPNPPEFLNAAHSYTQQLARYGALLQQAYPDHSFKAGVLWTQTGAVHWVSPAVLSQSLDQQRYIQALT